MALQEAVAAQVEQVQLLLELQVLVAEPLQMELQILVAEQEAQIQVLLLHETAVVV
jgi:hypothetical protein